MKVFVICKGNIEVQRIFKDDLIRYTLIESVIARIHIVFVCLSFIDIKDAVAGGDGIREELESVIAELVP